METKFGKFTTTRAFERLLLFLVVAATCYMGLRAGNAAAFLWGRGCYVPAFVLTLLILLLLAYGQQAGNARRIDRWCKRFSGCFLSFLLYGVLTLLVSDLAGLIFRFSQPVRAWLVLAAAVFSLLFLLYGNVHARKLHTVRYTVNLEEGNGSTKIVLLSDLHIGIYIGEAYLKHVVDQVNHLAPDMVILAGDLFDGSLPAGDRELDRIAAVLRILFAPGGVYAVVGNHDPSVTQARFRHFLEKANIRLLYNETVELPQMNLVGRAGIVDQKDLRVPLGYILQGSNPKKRTVVVDHDPQGIREAASCGADLVLCGHTHKGQFFPMTALAKWANGKSYFYGAGVFGKTHSIISAGTGFFQIPIRIGTNSEIVLIDVRW